MNELIQKLLQPISADQPCGPDLSYDGRFAELETILKGKPEIDFGNIKKPAEPPDWRQLQEKSAEFLQQTKHLRGATMFCCSLLRTTGLVGFRDGLQLIHGLLERYWPNLYPSLDPEDNNDPTYRLNVLGALTAPRGSVSGWLTFLDYLYTTPVCQPKGAAPLTFDQLQAAKLRQPGAEDSGGPSLASLVPLLRAGASQIAANHQALQEALQAVQAIDQFLTTTLSAGKTISFEELQKTLQEMVTGLEPYLPGGESQPAADAAGTAPAATSTGGESGQILVSGSIRSREDVVTALENICRYYDQVEPGSPVPFLLRRAQKLATMNFVQAVQELNLISSLDALRPSMGSSVESAAPPAETPAAS